MICVLKEEIKRGNRRSAKIETDLETILREAGIKLETGLIDQISR